MEEELIVYLIDQEFELEISKDREIIEQDFISRYKVLDSNIKFKKKLKK